MVVVVVVIATLGLTVVPSPTPGPAVTSSPAAILRETTLPAYIVSMGSNYSEAKWQFPIFDYQPCTNMSTPATDCTSLNATLTPGGYYQFSFQVNNSAPVVAEIVDMGTYVPFSYSSVPTQYCGWPPDNNSGVPAPGDEVSVPAHSLLTISMNLTLPASAGVYNPGLYLWAVLGNCNNGGCSWGC